MRLYGMTLMTSLLTLSASAGAADLNFLKNDKPVSINGSQSLYYYEGNDPKNSSLCYLMLQVSDDKGQLKLTGIGHNNISLVSERASEIIPSATTSALLKDRDPNHLEIKIAFDNDVSFVDAAIWGGSNKWKAQLDIEKDQSGRPKALQVKGKASMLERLFGSNGANFKERCEGLRNITQVRNEGQRQGPFSRIEKFANAQFDVHSSGSVDEVADPKLATQKSKSTASSSSQTNESPSDSNSAAAK